MVAMVTRNKRAWISLFFAFSSNKMLSAIIYMHVETMKTDMDLGLIQETNTT